MTMKWRIGTSGWNYKHWKEAFYPPQTPVSRWLEFYTGVFDTVEVNATFYRLPKPETFENWHKRTPDGFLWAVKASKFITHTKRLKEVREPLNRLYKALEGLGSKLGPILFQLPPSLQFDKERLLSFCGLLRPSHRHTLEIRHPSWICDDVFALLNKYNIAFCISDTAGKYPFHEAITADFIYIRLHGSKTLYASEYTEEELQSWAKKIKAWGRETFLYFDNDFNAFAVKNAERLKTILQI